MFSQFVIEDLGRDPKTFNLDRFWKEDVSLAKNIIDETGSTLPIFIGKLDYLKVGGWDENYEMGMVADWDFFLKCQLSGLKMLRTYNTHFYHFVSLSTTDTAEKQQRRLESEQAGHHYAIYKWGTTIKHDPISNLKYL
jgi:GT2 family glycosyltransferase